METLKMLIELAMITTKVTRLNLVMTPSLLLNLMSWSRAPTLPESKTTKDLPSRRKLATLAPGSNRTRSTPPLFLPFTCKKSFTFTKRSKRVFWRLKSTTLWRPRTLMFMAVYVRRSLSLNLLPNLVLLVIWMKNISLPNALQIDVSRQAAWLLDSTWMLLQFRKFANRDNTRWSCPQLTKNRPSVIWLTRRTPWWLEFCTTH